MRFMRRLKLRTILSLVPEPSGPCSDFTDYCRAENIRHIWHHVEKYNDGFSHTPDLVASVISNLIDPKNHPLFLHCRDGGHNSGLVVMCLRRLQNWSLSSIHAEFKRYTKSNEITYVEKQFVECFHATVTIPVRIPKWLWDGVRHSKHPSFSLQLEKHDMAVPPTSLKNCNVSRSRQTRLFESLTTTPVQQDKEISSKFGQRLVHARIGSHYTRNFAALDLRGVHFLDCCKPDMYGHGSAVCRGQPNKS